MKIKNFKLCMATAMERKFTGLRKRLDQLGYRQPLGSAGREIAQ